MLTVAEAQARILSNVPRVGRERLPLELALDRLLAAPITAAAPLPAWDNSAMDGFAVRASDTPGTLAVVDHIPAGVASERVVGPGQAARIMTGAPIPPGADAVVMVERTAPAGPGRVEIQIAAAPGQHIRRQGSDVVAGAVVLPAGTALTPPAVGMCASLGHPSVEVALRPRVAIVSTGDEIVEPGYPLGPGQLWSSNAVALAGWVSRTGGAPVVLGTVRDDPDALAEAFERALTCDVVLSTGGVSVGDHDHVKPVLERLGVEIDFWKVAMKPGKPLAFGRRGRAAVFGLPGNPVSCVVNYLLFARPYLRAMMGDPSPSLPTIRAHLDTPYTNRGDRLELVRVALVAEARGVVARVLTHQGSGNLRSWVGVHGLLIAPQGESVGEVPVLLVEPPAAGASPW